MADLIKRVRELREEVWEHKPADIESLTDKSRGFTDTWDSTFFPTVYSWLETVSARNVFYVMRKTIMNEAVEMETAKVLIRDLAAMFVPFLKWANLPEAANVLTESAEGIEKLETKEEVGELLEELVLYMGRLNYWVEPEMPWPEFIETFNKVKA